MDTAHIVVCDGDQTGQELLLESLRVLDPQLLGLPIELEHFDLSLANRRATDNAVILEAARAMSESGLGLKAATITPPERDGVGSPNRILREAIDGSVIVRTGRPIPGVKSVIATSHPIAVVRMAVGDAYGAEEGREGSGENTESAWRTQRISRWTCRSVARYAFQLAAELGGEVYGGPKWTVSPNYEGMLKEEMDLAASQNPDTPYRPVLIDALYAALVTENFAHPLVIPSLNRDGDCLSDLVIALFGSIAGAESVLFGLDDELRPRVAMAEAPHGTAPSLEGKNLANPMAMLLACAAVLDQAAVKCHNVNFAAAATRVREATMATAVAGIRTFDLGGNATTSEVVDAVIAHVRATS